MTQKKCPLCGSSRFIEFQLCTYRGFVNSKENGELDYFDSEFVSVDEVDGIECRDCHKELPIDFLVNDKY